MGAIYKNDLCDGCNQIKPRVHGVGDAHNDFLAFCEECWPQWVIGKITEGEPCSELSIDEPQTKAPDWDGDPFSPED